jgi:hypothetical protein
MVELYAVPSRQKSKYERPDQMADTDALTQLQRTALELILGKSLLDAARLADALTTDVLCGQIMVGRDEDKDAIEIVPSMWETLMAVSLKTEYSGSDSTSIACSLLDALSNLIGLPFRQGRRDQEGARRFLLSTKSPLLLTTSLEAMSLSEGAKSDKEAANDVSPFIKLIEGKAPSFIMLSRLVMLAAVQVFGAPADKNTVAMPKFCLYPRVYEDVFERLLQVCSR